MDNMETIKTEIGNLRHQQLIHEIRETHKTVSVVGITALVSIVLNVILLMKG